MQAFMKPRKKFFDEYTKKLLKVEDENLRKMHEIVINSLKEKDGLIEVLYKESEDNNLSFGQKLADKVAMFGGSWKFIILFTVTLIVWMSYNVHIGEKAFDPYPFILLNLVLSCIAAIQAPVIMMSQNRKEEKDRKRAEHEYLVNLKAELQIRELNQKIDLLMIDEMNTLLAIQKDQIEKLNDLENKLVRHLKNTKKDNF